MVVIETKKNSIFPVTITANQENTNLRTILCVHFLWWKTTKISEHFNVVSEINVSTTKFSILWKTALKLKVNKFQQNAAFSDKIRTTYTKNIKRLFLFQ